MFKLKVLGIMGSPRKGNSAYLLDRALEGAASYDPPRVSTEIFSFRGKKMSPCIACNHCIKNDGACIHDDDFLELKDMWIEADAIIYSLPVYHMSMPGQVKCFIDRLGNSMFGSHHVTLPDGTETLSKQMKAIGTIAQGIHIFSGQEHTITDIINHTLLMQSVPVSGDMWEAYIGAGAWTKNRISRRALEELSGESDLDTEAAITASIKLGRRVVQTADILLSGMFERKEVLELDPLYRYVLQHLAKRWEA
jgi:multimeric flavodoxin WrbA